MAAPAERRVARLRPIAYVEHFRKMEDRAYSDEEELVLRRLATDPRMDEVWVTVEKHARKRRDELATQERAAPGPVNAIFATISHILDAFSSSRQIGPIRDEVEKMRYDLARLQANAVELAGVFRNLAAPASDRLVSHAAVVNEAALICAEHLPTASKLLGQLANYRPVLSNLPSSRKKDRVNAFAIMMCDFFRLYLGTPLVASSATICEVAFGFEDDKDRMESLKKAWAGELRRRAAASALQAGGGLDAKKRHESSSR